MNRHRHIREIQKDVLFASLDWWYLEGYSDQLCRLLLWEFDSEFPEKDVINAYKMGYADAEGDGLINE